jgi:hypothetical protein
MGNAVTVSTTTKMTTTRITSSLVPMTRNVTIHLLPRIPLTDGFYCSQKNALITDERYCRNVCDRQGVNCEHRKTKYAQHHF